MKLVNGVLLCVLMLVVGCGTSDVDESAAAPQSSADAKPFVATTEPADAIPVGTARELVQGEQEVTLVGRIGGSSEPFVDGLAAFTIVDPKVPHCSADEGCPTPWDYCCTQDQVKGNIATVKVVDDSGKVVSGDARQLLQVKELSTVVVHGKAKRDDQGNLTVAATHVFVRPSE
ncbi:MAG: hypothetical protein KDA92_13895 [Planctomycetales bacterium]|nr:hypothetical protein [Planctomycetales bacterium]